jgi:hypothetical protein
MRNAAIRPPLSRALIMYAAPGPALSLRCTAGSIPSRLRRSSRARTTAIQQRVRIKPLVPWRRCESVPFGSMVERRRRSVLFGSAVERRRRPVLFGSAVECRRRSVLPRSPIKRWRRDGLKPGVQRSGTPGNVARPDVEPLERGGGQRCAKGTAHQTGAHARAGSL